MWNHYGWPKKIWSGILVVLLIYTATVMPYKIALIDDGENIEMFYLDTIVDFLFVFDIYVNFNTPFKSNTDAYVYNRKIITGNYIKSWFIVDLLASAPMNMI